MGLITVSGCPRSGTSLMMNILKTAIGDEFLLGKKFPMEREILKLTTQQKGETEAEFNVRLYSMEKLGLIDEVKEKFEKSKDMNPNGFWEDGRFSVSGLNYNQRSAELINKIRNDKNHYIGKIVSQGLNNTDPQLIHKMVFMMRNPYSVAKSQERLRRKGEFNYKGKDINIYDDVKVHTPQMFIEVTLKAAKYFADNKIDVIFINYEDLMERPKETMNKIGEFLKKGDFTKSYDLVDKSLYRSKVHEKPTDNLWNDADRIYELFLNNKFEEIVNEFGDENKEINKLHKNWHCMRTNRKTIEAHCNECMKGDNFMLSLKNQAIKDNIDWKNEPCVYECTYKKNYTHISINDSIKNNHWK